MEESPGGKRDPARFAVLFQKSEFEMREFGKLCGGIIEDERRESPLPENWGPGVMFPWWRSHRSGGR